MNPKDTSNEELIEIIDGDEDVSSVDDFIKELEEKEKDLDISSDLVIEVDESEVEHDNIHDTFIANPTAEIKPFEASLSGSIPFPMENDFKDESPNPQLQKQIDKLKKERNELKDSLKRRQRDFDNYRARTERERSETFKNILGNFATKILPVLDNMNRALDSTAEAGENPGERDFQTFLHGVELVNQQLNEVLMEMGVQPIPSVGEPFDPAFHEAVATEETDDYPHKTVIQELLRGYRIDDKIVRASMVKVSSSQTSQSSQSIEQE